MKDLKDYSLLQHNTFGISAQCSRFLEYGSVEEAVHVAELLRESGQPYMTVGQGSNLLLTQDYRGTVVHSAIGGVSASGLQVVCGSGVLWDDVVAWTVEHQLYGAENLSLIPGEVGASAVQNIGAYGVEVKDLISDVEAVEIATGRLCHFSNTDCCYGYRDSRFKHEWRNAYLITHVTYQMESAFKPKLEYGNIRTELELRQITDVTPMVIRQLIIDIRRAKLPDPAVTGNAGSFFMNPVVTRRQYEVLAAEYPNMPHYTVDADHEKIPAGWLIDQCGWKGRSLQRAGVHDRQALVLVNLGGATGSEILDLCHAVQRDVKERFAIDIRPEVNIV